MLAKLEIELKPFKIPDLVFEDTKTGASTGVSLASLTPEALDDMCDAFRVAVFEKAGKQRPPSCMPKTYDVARARQILSGAEYLGSDFDAPEGNRYIMLSETLVNQLLDALA